MLIRGGAYPRWYTGKATLSFRRRHVRPDTRETLGHNGSTKLQPVGDALVKRAERGTGDGLGATLDASPLCPKNSQKRARSFLDPDPYKGNLSSGELDSCCGAQRGAVERIFVTRENSSPDKTARDKRLLYQAFAIPQTQFRSIRNQTNHIPLSPDCVKPYLPLFRTGVKPYLPLVSNGVQPYFPLCVVKKKAKFRQKTRNDLR